MRTGATLAGLVLALHVSTTFACGHCVEDKIAAVYDHALVTQAMARQQQVAFFAIEGNLEANDASRKSIESIARAIDGVMKNSVKVSVDTASLSFVFDPKMKEVGALQKAIEKKMANKKLSLQLMKVMAAADKIKVSVR